MLRPTDDIVRPTTVTQLLSSDQTVKKSTWHKFDNLLGRYVPANFTHIMYNFLDAI